MSTLKKRYKHYCPVCILLGRLGRFDLYFCKVDAYSEEGVETPLVLVRPSRWSVGTMRLSSYVEAMRPDVSQSLCYWGKYYKQALILATEQKLVCKAVADELIFNSENG